MIAQLLLGRQTETVKTFLSLSASERVTFSGWSTSGWVRWLAGLRGTYERRMTRMCTILDSNKDGIRSLSSGRDSVMVFKSPLFSFSWPRGGMFAWVKVHLDKHACYLQKGEAIPRITGRILADAMLMFLTKEPYKTLVAPGAMFAANGEIKEGRAWRYFRLCFAAEDEDRVNRCSRLFTEGVAEFFNIRDVRTIEELVEDAKAESAVLEGVANMGLYNKTC